MKGVFQKIRRGSSVSPAAPLGDGKPGSPGGAGGWFRRGSALMGYNPNQAGAGDGVGDEAPRLGLCGRLCSRMCKRGGKTTWSPFRVYVHRVVKSTTFSNFILGVIFLNSVLITLQMIDSTNLVGAYYFDVFDKVLMGIYILELSLKLYAHQERFLDSGWNVFDAFIVSISVIETAVYTVLNNESSISPAIFRLFRVFKALRAMRAIRAISFLKNLQVIIVTLLKSIPAMGSIILLLMLIMYICAIIFVTLYKEIIPDRFGNLWISMFSLFQLITLDDWSEYYYKVYEKDPSQANSIMMYMMVFIVLETFICINLFIAVIVNNLERANMKEKQRKRRQELELKKKRADADVSSELHFIKKKKRKKRKKRTKDEVEDGKKRKTKEGDKKEEEEVPDSNDDDESDDEESALHTKTPSEAFLHDPSLPYWQRELQPEVLSLVAALEYNVSLLHSQQQTLDNLVDVTVAGPCQQQDGDDH